MTNIEHLAAIEKARQEFMSGKRTAESYWKARVRHLNGILQNNELAKKIKAIEGGKE